MVRPYLEKLPVSPDASIAILDRRLEDGIPFLWHHHPEYELTLTLNSEGQRFIGDHVGPYGHADLVLVGPNLPHTWSSIGRIDADKPHVALVFWFRQTWVDSFLGAAIEFAAVHRMFDRASAGISFGNVIGASLKPSFVEAIKAEPPRRLMILLDILMQLSAIRDPETLASVIPPGAGEGRTRIDRVLQHLHQSYDRPVRLSELAGLAALSVSGLHRMFVKHTGTTVSAYVARLRIGDACARLSATDQPVAGIAEDVGYDNLANFNRQFRALRGMAPRDYRHRFRRQA
ncbi:helix-turn-helix domain-containing protein [Rhizobium sp. G187]|uniref:helix-turn-helix domain-containing protein n=1 Tax=Rhizobium sp. G187 TaxID=3451352 RepID=UPI003EE7C24F